MAKNKLQRIFNSFPTNVTICDGSKPMFKGDKPKKQKLFFGCNYEDQPTVGISWSIKGRGFGEYVFYKENGKLKCKSEMDSREEVKRVLCTLVDQCEFTEVHDPKERAPKYDRK
jgi:hypothetical protein